MINGNIRGDTEGNEKFDKGNFSLDPTKKLFLSLKETASMLGLSPRSFHELKSHHPLYAPDSSRTIKDNPKKDSPLWSAELVRLIAFARLRTEQGVRSFTDDEALKVRKGMNAKKRQEYISYINE